MTKQQQKDICTAMGALRGFIEAMNKGDFRDMQTFKDIMSNTLQSRINTTLYERETK